MAVDVLIAKGKQSCSILLRMANRHGLIAGATGTGKTVTLRVIAEQLSRAGVSVFMADVKGDLSGIARPGSANPRISERAAQLGIENFQFADFPTVFWDLFGAQGHPVRTTVSDMGPLLLARLLNLNETQSGVLTLVFKIADDNGMLLLDLKDSSMSATMPPSSRPNTATSRRRASAPSNAGCWRWRSRAAKNSSASRRSISKISCRPTAPGMA
jgi:hypothetical protein